MPREVKGERKLQLTADGEEKVAKEEESKGDCGGSLERIFICCFNYICIYFKGILFHL